MTRLLADAAHQPTLHSVEAEQALLGAILLRNEIYDRIADAISAEDFYEPVHARIFDAIVRRMQANTLASPVTLKTDLADDPGLAILGGPAYLVRMAGATISLSAAREYATYVRELAQKRSLADLLQRQAALLAAEPESTVEECLAEIDAHVVATGRSSGSGQPVSLLRAASDAIQESCATYRGDGSTAVLSGISALDDLTGGLFPADLAILAGRPSMGKTTLALSIAMNVARAGGGVGFFSMEMRQQALALRAISEITARAGFNQGVAYADLRAGRVGEDQMRRSILAAKETEDFPLMIFPPSVRELGAVLAGARRLRRDMERKGKPLRLIIVDYLQLARVVGSSRYEKVTEISLMLKEIAALVEVPLLALSQLSRAVEQREDKRPQLSDLRESGSIEQDADVVMFCYREEYYLRRSKPPERETEAKKIEYSERLAACAGKMDIIVDKVRQGPIGVARVELDERFNLITDLRQPVHDGLPIEGFA